MHLAKDGPVNKQWAEEKLRASPSYGSTVNFLIKRMSSFTSSNNLKEGGDACTAKKEAGGSAENNTNPAGPKDTTLPSASVHTRVAHHPVSVPMLESESFAAKQVVSCKVMIYLAVYPCYSQLL